MSGGGQAVTSTEVEATERVGTSTWLKLLGAGVGVFAVFVSLINLASVAGNHGFEWHHLIRSAIENYRETFYPFYEAYLKPVFDLVRIELTPTIKDVLTLLSATFLAANAESIIRDRRLLLMNILRNIEPLGRHALRLMFLRKEPRNDRKPRSILFKSWVGYPIAISFGLGYVGALLALIFVDFQPLIGFRLSSLPSWYWWSLGLGFSTVEGIFIAFVMRGREQPGWLIVVTFPLMLPVLPQAAFMAACAVALSVIAIIVLTPIAAWRTVSITLVLFVLLFGANYAFAHGYV